MNCPQCNNKISEKAKFCPACGKEIDIENAEKTSKENPASYIGGAGKKILVVVIGIAVILMAVLIAKGIKNRLVLEITNGEEMTETTKVEETETDNIEQIPLEKEAGFTSYEEAIDAFYAAVFSKDVEAMVNSFPEEIHSELIERYNRFRSNDNSDETHLFGFMWDLKYEYSYELGEATKMEDDEIREFQTKYGFTLDRGYTVATTIFESYDYGFVAGTAMPSVPIKVAKIDKNWYVIYVDDYKIMWH